MALTQRQLRNETERLKAHYQYLLDELEIAAGDIERRTDLIRAHPHDLERKECAIPPGRKGKTWNKSPKKTPTLKDWRRTKKSNVGE